MWPDSSSHGHGDHGDHGDHHEAKEEAAEEPAEEEPAEKEAGDDAEEKKEDKPEAEEASSDDEKKEDSDEKEDKSEDSSEDKKDESEEKSDSGDENKETKSNSKNRTNKKESPSAQTLGATDSNVRVRCSEFLLTIDLVCRQPRPSLLAKATATCPRSRKACRTLIPSTASLSIRELKKARRVMALRTQQNPRELLTLLQSRLSRLCRETSRAVVYFIHRSKAISRRQRADADTPCRYVYLESTSKGSVQTAHVA